MTHFATVLSAAKTIDTTDRTLPETVPDGYVRLRLATASLCGTDLHYYRHFANAGFILNRPVTLGHEACAYVTDPNGNGFKTDQLVALNPIIKCGACAPCLAGQENHCTAKKFPGSATTVPHVDGFFQAEFDFPAACCHPVPEDTNPDHLTFAEPLACAMHSVTLSGAMEGDKVLVTGCGPMGLLTVVALLADGIEVDVTDVRQEAIDLAVKIGARKGYVAGDSDLPENHYDAIIEASGSPHAVNQSLNSVKRKGRISILSIIQPSNTPIDLHKITIKEVVVTGSFQFNMEFKKALNLITSGKRDFEELIAARYPLAQTTDALEFMLSGQAAGKILIKPEA
ncbi:MAG: alcohol dehydrogenase catalytic domain-containing protein [Roseibium sp.]